MGINNISGLGWVMYPELGHHTTWAGCQSDENRNYFESFPTVPKEQMLAEERAEEENLYSALRTPDFKLSLKSGYFAKE